MRSPRGRELPPLHEQLRPREQRLARLVLLGRRVNRPDEPAEVVAPEVADRDQVDVSRLDPGPRQRARDRVQLPRRRWPAESQHAV